MKLFKKILACVTLCGLFVFGAASCSNAASNSKVSKAYADSINNSATAKTYITVETAKKDLGKECNDWTFDGSGIMFAVKGYDNIENEEAFNKLVLGGDEKTVYCALVITCKDNNCVSALYVEGTGDQVGEKIMTTL